jgi:hypothetical protein
MEILLATNAEVAIWIFSGPERSELASLRLPASNPRW